MYVYYMYYIHTYYTWYMYVYIKITGFLDFKKLQITHQIQFTSKHTTNTNGNKLNSSILCCCLFVVSLCLFMCVCTHTGVKQETGVSILLPRFFTK